jgi:hypothetical protein
MAQLSEPTIAARRPAASLPTQQRTALAGCSVWRRIISQSETLRIAMASKTCRRKTLEMSIPPYYLAFRDRN